MNFEGKKGLITPPPLRTIYVSPLFHQHKKKTIHFIHSFFANAYYTSADRRTHREDIVEPNGYKTKKEQGHGLGGGD